MDNYDLVLEYLLSEGYSHKEATSIMVDENWRQNLLNFVSGRLKTPVKTALTDLTTTAVSLTPGQSVKPAVSSALQAAQPAPIVRQVVAPATPNLLQQVAAPFKKVRNIVRQLNPAKPTAGSLPQGKPGGSVVPASKPGTVTPSAKPASGITNTSGGSSVATRSGSGQVTQSGTNVSTPSGPLAKAGPVIDVKPTLSGTPTVQRIAPGKVANFKPTIKVNPTPPATSGSTGSIDPNKAALVAAGLSVLRGDTKQTTGLTKAQRDSKLAQQRAETQAASQPAPEPRGERSADTNDAKQERAKAEYQQVVTKKKVVPPVKQPERPRVDPEVQRYRQLVKQGKRLEAEKLGREIYQRTHGAPAFRPTKTA